MDIFQLVTVLYTNYAQHNDANIKEIIKFDAKKQYNAHHTLDYYPFFPLNRVINVKNAFSSNYLLSKSKQLVKQT